MAVFDKDKLFDKDKVSKSAASTVWETPPEVFDPVNDEFNFTLDVCATPQNAKCDRYLTEAKDGLLSSWDGEVCWCNPPYGKDVKKWCKKALDQSKKGTTTVLLIPCKTNTNWWHDLVIPFAEIRFLRGRVRFIQDGVQYDNAYVWSLAFVIYHGKN